MVEVEINKDIKQYEAKLIAGLTTRQAICLTVSGILSIGAYNTIGKYLPRDLRLYICLAFASPGLLMGWVKVYGMRFEQFLKIYLSTQILSPAIRKYKSENVFDVKTPVSIATKKKENKRRKKSVEKFNKKNKHNPEYKAYL